MATIKAIEGRTIHQIQSGQVIVDLCSVVKELVENSLDADATSIEIRFKNQGLDSIEVQDNGNGITPQNYETVALKHHTSKLSTYSDLSTLQTFGFRGEALSSLCALSQFTITTCLASDAPKGTKLDFEFSGEIKSTSVIAAQKGTTVVVENLFYNLPVRRRELERNIKREWNRVIGLLGQYACIQTGVKISVTQQPLKGKKTTLFSTKGNPTTRENIVNVFGAKTLTALLTLDLKLELEPTSGPSQQWSTKSDGDAKEIRIIGHISRPALGEGRQTPDRQMFFVNSRPCSLPQVAKAFNEVYKSYNSIQSPFIFANIEMDTNQYDVNVSPDKRTILLHEQTRMLEHLRTSLIQLFESQDYTVPISQLPAQRQPSYKQLTITRQDEGLKESPRHKIESAESTERVPGSSILEILASSGHDSDEESPKHVGRPQIRPTAVLQDSVDRDSGAISLISNWLGRKINERPGPKEVKQKTSLDKDEGLSNEKRRLVKKFGKEKQHVLTVEKYSEDGFGNLLEAGPVSHEIMRPVQDFNRGSAEVRAEDTATKPDYSPAEIEDPIPRLVSPSRRPVAALEAPGYSIVRPHRAPATVATITIGNHTVTSPIGTPSKRPRIERDIDYKTSSSPLPSFGSQLTQRFGAAGTAVANQQAEAPDVDMADLGDGTESLPAVEEEVSPTMGDSSSVSEQEEAPQRQVPMEELSRHSPAEDSDDDYIDDEEKKVQEEAKVSEMIKAAEEDAARPSDDNAKRAHLLLKGGARKDSTLQLVQNLEVTIESIASKLRIFAEALSKYSTTKEIEPLAEKQLDQNAEEKLSLTINKSDFANMRIVGQFNLGFILATRTRAHKGTEPSTDPVTDDLFIIDQHASDEKYNFERLQATTIVQSQRLVQPKTLDLTAIEEEIVMENLPALETNGFIVTIDNSGSSPVGQRCQLIALPLSRETTFSLSDLEELLSLLASAVGGTIPRPSKVRKMFAMRACRSSIMIGRTLTTKQMGKVVRHMGELDKPWNCPHGRPTMRHLANLDGWDVAGWREGMKVVGDGDGDDDSRIESNGRTDWAGYVRRMKGTA